MFPGRSKSRISSADCSPKRPTRNSSAARLRRKVVERIELRDRPVMDKFQGEIFRLPLDRQVILFGPPGSGKTTTLIKRLAQKRTPDALTEGEERIMSGYIRENL